MYLKEFSIRIPQLDVCNLYNAVSTKNNSPNLNSIKAIQINKKSLFSRKSYDNIFFSIFQKFISRVENYLPISKAEIIHKANNNLEFAPVLSRLKSRHTGDVYHKVYAKIRTIGNCLRKSNGKKFLNLTPSTKSQLDLTFQTGHHKSIFLLQKDEDLFFSVFSEMITGISERKIVRKVEILDRYISPLLDKLQTSVSLSTIDKMLFNKVRTMGNVLRKKY